MSHGSSPKSTLSLPQPLLKALPLRLLRMPSPSLILLSVSRSYSGPNHEFDLQAYILTLTPTLTLTSSLTLLLMQGAKGPGVMQLQECLIELKFMHAGLSPTLSAK